MLWLLCYKLSEQVGMMSKELSDINELLQLPHEYNTSSQDNLGCRHSDNWSVDRYATHASPVILSMNIVLVVRRLS